MAEALASVVYSGGFLAVYIPWGPATLRQICFRRDTVPTGSVAEKTRNLIIPTESTPHPEYKHHLGQNVLYL